MCPYLKTLTIYSHGSEIPVSDPFWIEANWPVPETIRAGTTHRHGGISQVPYYNFNLAQHVNDSISDVESNRKTLHESLGLPRSPYWLEQVHGTTVINLDSNPPRW